MPVCTYILISKFVEIGSLFPMGTGIEAIFLGVFFFLYGAGLNTAMLFGRREATTRTLIGKTQESPRALMKGRILSYTKLSSTQNSSLTLSKLPAIKGAYSCVTCIRLVTQRTGAGGGGSESSIRVDQTRT